MSDTFRTIIPFQKNNASLKYHHKIMSLGSCFSLEMGKILVHHKFNVLINPFGISYHPSAIAQQIQHIVENKKFKKKDLFFYEDQWHSFMHHSDYSHINSLTALQHINTQIELSHTTLKTLDVLLITFGTAYAYMKVPENFVVNNCHRLPSINFLHQLCTFSELVQQYKTVLISLRDINPNLKFIFTVSPVRHKNITPAENSLSKAHLLLLSHSLTREFSNSYYFSAYELMMDDLRDYRFYEADMIHPNKQAIAYIFRHFKMEWIDKEEYHWMDKIAGIKSGLLHQPKNQNSIKHQAFLKKLKQEMLQISAEKKSISFDEEIAVLAILKDD